MHVTMLGRGVWLGVILTLGLSCGPPAPLGPLNPDVCSNASMTAAIDRLELGAEDTTTFAPLTNGSSVPLRFGSQGGTMVVVRLRVSGPQPPECLAETTTISSTVGTELARSTLSVRTYEEAPGTRSTERLYLIFDGTPPATGDMVVIASTAHGQSASVTVRIGP